MTKLPQAHNEPPVMIGSREQLLHLLAEAAEIEHTLMCSYLYAAFSLKRADEMPSAAEGEAVEHWRKIILDVAVAEMGHLLLVANLTVAIGGRPHFARPNFPVAPGYFPSGVVVRLAGFSHDTLEHFIFLERPQGMDAADSDRYDQEPYERTHAHPGLMPSAQDYATIGHLYDAIRQNLDALAEHLGSDKLFIGGVAGQIGPAIVDLEGIALIDGLPAARKAIEIIIEQGEGSPADRLQSHYRSFLQIRETLDKLASNNPRFAPAWPVADNPVLRRPPDPEDKVFVDDPHAAELLDFACAAYGLLTRVLVQAFARSGATVAEDQKMLIGLAFDLMHVLGSASTRLAQMSASGAAPGINAGMTFTMLRGVEPLLHGAVETQMIQEQLNELVRGSALTDRTLARAKSRLHKWVAEFRLGP